MLEKWDIPRTKEKHFEILIIAVLLTLGIYHSALYYGHQVVPNPDYYKFITVADELLSFESPSSYKHAPVLGMLLRGISYLIGGQQSEVRAGWLLNAILHPFNIILLWLVGRSIIGRSAVWVSIIAMANPWVLQSLTQPLAETTLLFFILLTFYFIFRNSKWSYLFASITTMVRYEGAALILAAFIIDILNSTHKRQRFMAFVKAALATVPLTIWMLGTIVNWDSETTHYIKEAGLVSDNKIVFLPYLRFVWYMAISSLFKMNLTGSYEIVQVMLNRMSKILTVISFAFGSVYGLSKRQWNVLALLIFLLPFIFVHSVHSWIIGRHGTAIHWIVLIICVYGLKKAWQLIVQSNRVPKSMIIVMQAFFLTLTFAWLISVMPSLQKLAQISPRSVSVPYVTAAIIAVVFIVWLFLYKGKYLWSNFIVSMLLCCMVVSNQFALVNTIRNGQNDIEFKLLGEWYIENAEPSEKMLVSLPSLVRIFAPQYGEFLIPTGAIKAQNRADFIKQCYDRNITYVIWDSRVGLRVGSRYYNLWGIENIDMLSRPQTVDRYDFIEQIWVNKKQFINIFRLRKPASVPAGQYGESNPR